MDYKVLKEASELLTFYIDALEAAKYNLGQAKMFEQMNLQRTARVKLALKADAERRLACANVQTANRTAHRVALLLIVAEEIEPRLASLDLVNRAWSLSVC